MSKDWNRRYKETLEDMWDEKSDPRFEIGGIFHRRATLSHALTQPTPNLRAWGKFQLQFAISWLQRILHFSFPNKRLSFYHEPLNFCSLLRPTCHLPPQALRIDLAGIPPNPPHIWAPMHSFVLLRDIFDVEGRFIASFVLVTVDPITPFC